MTARCSANVTGPWTLRYRASQDPSTQCQRAAKIGNLCQQHHRALWHNITLSEQDVERILRMPAR